MKELPVFYDLCPMYSCEYNYHDYVMLDIYYIPGYMNNYSYHKFLRL